MDKQVVASKILEGYFVEITRKREEPRSDRVVASKFRHDREQ
jgi:hypothetical protein